MSANETAREWLTKRVGASDAEKFELWRFEWKVPEVLEMLEAYHSSRMAVIAERAAKEAAEKIFRDVSNQNFAEMKSLDDHTIEYIKHSWADIIQAAIERNAK